MSGVNVLVHNVATVQKEKNYDVEVWGITKNLHLTNGLIFSQEILLALVKSGMLREDAYEIVQKNAMRVWKEKKEFKKLLKEDSKIMECLSEEKVDKLFNLDKILININKIRHHRDDIYRLLSL